MLISIKVVVVAHVSLGASAGLTDLQELKTAMNILHAQRKIVHFQWNSYLRRFAVLDPLWLVTATNVVLESDYVMLDVGLLPVSQAVSVWSHYPAPLARTLLRFTESFGLTIPVPNGKIKELLGVLSLPEEQMEQVSEALKAPLTASHGVDDSLLTIVPTRLPPINAAVVKKLFPPFPQDHASAVYHYDRSIVAPAFPTGTFLLADPRSSW